MSSCVAFHTQVASIMEVLANAAVAEICKLVDDGYALLRLEMSQSQKENEQLRRKLENLELQVARGCGARRPAQREKGNFLPEESVFSSHMDLCRDTSMQSAVGRDVPADSVEVIPEPGLIKEETSEEDFGSHSPKEDMAITAEQCLDLGADAGERSEETSPSKSTEELADEHRSSHGAWELPNMEERRAASTLIKEERLDGAPGGSSPAEMLRMDEGREMDFTISCAERSAGKPSVVPGKGPAESSEPEGPECDAWDPHTWDGAPQAQAERGRLAQGRAVMQGQLLPDHHLFNVSGHQRLDDAAEPMQAGSSDQQLVPATEELASLGLSSRPCSWRADMLLLHADQRPPRMQHAAKGIADEAESKTPNSDECMTSVTDCLPHHRDKTHCRVTTKEKRFFCAFCGKGFNFPKQVEIHQRVHTGEKPFSCTQCRKQFSHSGNLKRHQRVHTGEKPFSCTQCDKRFSHLHQLKMHQRVHSGERPFSCTYCGKRYAERSYLRIHQQRNHMAIFGTSVSGTFENVGRHIVPNSTPAIMSWRTWNPFPEI
ncbi:endothelial zinc finger protein induced by tumor necrosis factor alpha-like isoform X2 [Brienomyrus brachyistius]|uniref:endothelial zinc finger protein induced by tumor necrosis factor alpha-like isoform X2 n=1 Tax=Brienomyrus brachyistius TaxID=42636 RepID=UPI0020B2703C|nr:endothelial zinc finger protein induced by tumor necrosis factor alpha-like isoform X2 [Brienomyrus brachyistius]